VLILPLIDLLILAGSGLLLLGFALKAVAITTVYHPTVLGFSSIDFVVMAAVCWGFALTLAARSWVKLHEGSLLRLRREQVQTEARRQAEIVQAGFAENGNGGTPGAPVARAARGDRG
jgi:hypothetical protein